MTRLHLLSAVQYQKSGPLIECPDLCLHVCVGLVGYVVLDIRECSWHDASLKQLEMKWRMKSFVECDYNVLSLY